MLTNWKTTLAGLVMLAFTAAQIYRNPSLLLDAGTNAKVAAGVGLLAAKDSGKD